MIKFNMKQMKLSLDDTWIIDSILFCRTRYFGQVRASRLNRILKIFVSWMNNEYIEETDINIPQ